MNKSKAYRIGASVLVLLVADGVGAGAMAQTETTPPQTPQTQATKPPSTQAVSRPKPAKPPAQKTPKPKKPAPEQDQNDTEVSELVVRGSPTIYRNMPGAVVGDIEPDLMLSPADVQSYGVSTVTDLLTELAPQLDSDQGRSAGNTSPVVLLNGKRISSLNEVTNIPTEAILRVDILPEEVALKYGFTADQKVINFVLRRRFRSISAELVGGGPTEGGQETGQAEGDEFNVRGDNRLNLDLKYSGNSDITYAARGVSGAPTAAGGAAQIDPSLNGLEAKDRDLTGSSQALTANGVLSRTLPWGLSGTINGTLGTTASQSLQGLPSLSLTLPAANPFNTTGSALQTVQYITGHGPLTQTGTGWTGHLGGTLNKELGPWRLSFTAAYDHADSLTVTTAGLNATPLQSLLNADSSSFNPYAAIASSMLALYPNTSARSFSDSGNAQALVNGPLVEGPAGPLYVSFKFGDTITGFRSHTEAMGLLETANLSRNDLNAQLNLDLPIASKRHNFAGFVGELSLNVHTAVDQLSDFNTLTALGYGLNWQPVPQVKLIVSETHDEAAPTVQQLGNPTVVTPGVRVYDYSTGQTVDVTSVSGGNPNLTSDHREVFKVGLTLKPIQSQDLSITAQYIDMHIRDAIETFPAATAAIEAAFPDRFIRDDGDLTEENLTPVNYAYSERRDIRWGINYSRPVGKQPPPRPAGGFPRRRQGAGQGGGPNTPRDPSQIAELPPGGAPPDDAGSGGGPPRAGAGPDGGGPPGGGGGPGGGAGGRGEGGGGGAGGRRGGGGFGAPPTGGRFQVAVYHTIYFTDQMLVRPGGPLLDLLNGAASGANGGQPLQQVQAQMGYTVNGWGARASANWVSGTTVVGSAISPSGNLTFSDLGTLNLRLFANFAQMRDVVRRHPWLRGSRVTINLVNLTDARQRVVDAAGLTPLSYQPALLNPAGRTVSLSLRKLFY